jgi:hypothetical protein
MGRATLTALRANVVGSEVTRLVAGHHEPVACAQPHDHACLDSLVLSHPQPTVHTLFVAWWREETHTC